MNLEQKLTDALDAAARTVPDTAEPPTVPAPAHRRRPVLIAALAAAAVVAAVAVPLAISRHDTTKGQVAGGVCPAPPAVQPLKIRQQNRTPDGLGLNKIPFGAPPRVPFTMGYDVKRGGGYLEDLGVRVPVETGFRYTTLGRVACGWAVYVQAPDNPSMADIGVLSTSGKYTSFGQVTGDGTAISPDGTELVYVSPTNDHKGELRVVEVATGKQTAGYGTDEKAEVVGWNSAGIWFMPGRDEARTTLWKPGSEPVWIDTGAHRVTAYRTTDRVLLSDQASPAADNCVRVAVLGASQKLKTLREKCGDSGGTLSPDGKVLVFGISATRAVLVDTGKATRLNVSPVVLRADHDMVWEDATHLTTSFGVGNDRSVVVRCDVVTGGCERIADGSWKAGPAGPALGYP
jgi:hypothetical protein